jgi:hypothetical protein
VGASIKLCTNLTRYVGSHTVAENKDRLVSMLRLGRLIVRDVGTVLSINGLFVYALVIPSQASLTMASASRTLSNARSGIWIKFMSSLNIEVAKTDIPLRRTVP